MNNILSFLKTSLNLLLSIPKLIGWGLFMVWLKLTELFRIIIGENRYAAIQLYRKQIFVKWVKFTNRFVDRKSPYYHTIKRCWSWFFGIASFGAFFVFCIHTNFLWLTGEMPSIEELQNPKLAQASELYTFDGVPLGKYFTENRTPVKDYKELSPWLEKALTATEDARFYEHSGIDYKALLGVTIGLLKGGERGGGSTITQQTAKNLFKTRKVTGIAKSGLLGYVPLVRKVVYKLKEWFTAIKLERHYTKQEILLLYLNTVDFGSNAYGIKVAAKTYFNKTPNQLTVQECAVLVGLQKATTTYNPIINYEKSLRRRNTVLNQMVKYQHISQYFSDSVSKLPIELNVTIEQPYAGSEGYFKKYINDYLNDWAKKNDIDIDLYRDGLKIITTVDSRMQAHAEEAVAEGMKNLQKTFDNYWRGKNPWTDEQGNEIPAFIDTVAKRTAYFKLLSKRFRNNPDSVWYFMNKPHKMKVFSWNGVKTMEMSSMDSIRYYKRFLQAGMISLDPYTGHIKAWVGGLDFNYFKYDHVKQARRQPGSTFKPLAYCAAIDGPANMSPCDKFQDKPLKYEYGNGGEMQTWEPQNADGHFSYNNYTLRQGLAKSVNSIAIQVTERVGTDTVIYYARKLGITSTMRRELAICLGTPETSLYELTAAYTAFLNNGYYTQPLLVTRIEDSKGNVIHEFQAETQPVLKPESAWLMLWLLRGGIEERGGTSQNLWSFPELFPNHQAQYAGKTGTTSNYSDGWYVGITKDLITGVWVGGDDRSIHFRTGAYGEGSKTALPLFGRFMSKVFKDPDLPYRPGPFPPPSVEIKRSYKDCVSGGGIRNTTTEFSDSLNVSPNIIENATPPDSTGGG